MSLKAQALAYARDGIPVHPCHPGTKVSAILDWERNASCDPAQVERWWNANPDYNIAVCPNNVGWLVVDLDRAKSESELPGEIGWKHVCEEHGYITETFTVRSPTGGRHLYFIGQGPTTARTFVRGSAIDTRGEGGYILLPPSVIGGVAYEIESSAQIAELPTFVKDGIARTTRSAPAIETATDTTSNIARARRHLLDTAGRVGAGQAGSRSAATYLRATELREIGLSLPGAMVQLEDHWFPCLDQPADDPFSLAELRATVQNAYKYAQNGAGAFAASEPEEAFAAALPAIVEASKADAERPSKFKPRSREDRKHQRPPEWLIPGVLLKATSVLLFGQWGTYKSYIALDLALSIATGARWRDAEPVKGPVFYAGLEGMPSVEASRAPAWEVARNTEATDLYTMRAPFISQPEECKEFVAQIAAVSEKPAAIFIDTVAKSSMGMDLNSGVEAGRVTAFCDALRDRFGCTVVAIHHSGKDQEKGMLGSILLPSNVDSTLEVRAVRNSRKAELWVRKFKDVAEPVEPFCFELASVANDLVPQPITYAEYIEATKDEDDLEPAVVGKALRDLGVAVTTSVLAGHLVSAAPGHNAENHHKAVEKMVKRLTKEARHRLAGYLIDGKWGLPGM